jgi:hypothetical protein
MAFFDPVDPSTESLLWPGRVGFCIVAIGAVLTRLLSLSKSAAVWAVTSDPTGRSSGWRRADSRLLRRLLGLTGKACVARRRPRTFGVT